MTHDIHVYPVFRVKLTEMQGEPAEMVAAAEMAVAAALNSRGTFSVEVTGQGFVNCEFAEGFDGALVDVMQGKRRVRSFTQSEQYDTAQEHAKALDGLIDGDNDDLGKMLGPIKQFLETIH